jgi:hypothetical protein
MKEILLQKDKVIVVHISQSGPPKGIEERASAGESKVLSSTEVRCIIKVFSSCGGDGNPNSLEAEDNQRKGNEGVGFGTKDRGGDDTTIDKVWKGWQQQGANLRKAMVKSEERASAGESKVLSSTEVRCIIKVFSSCKVKREQMQ